MKVWAVLFVCLQVKAIKIYLVGGLNTEDFLLAWDSFVADHGQPAVAYSDRGTNLTAAAREEGDTEIPDYDWDRIAQRGTGKTEWQFHPSGSQFRNGLVESFVKKFKRSLVYKYSSRMMFLLELETSFKIVASVLNSRPIYARWGSRGGDDPDFLSPLTPNMLLTGRSNTEVPVRDYERSDKPLYRLQYVEECLAQWWDQYMVQYFTSLVPRQKWFHEKRNMQIGDVVLIQYKGKCRPATYRLGVVIEVEVDDDGLVRTVSVEYSLLSELSEADRLMYKGITKKRLRVPVQRLVLILPVEERDQVLPGVQAGVDPAPLEEVCDRVSRTNNYDVVWVAKNKRYERKQTDSVGGGVQSGADSGVEIGGDVHVEEVVRNRKVEDKGGIRKEELHRQVLKSKFKCEDFEKKILEVKAKEYFDKEEKV